MASAPALSSSKEKTNYARLCRLLVDGGTQALRNIFDSIYPPANLHTALETPNILGTLISLKRNKIINPTQWGILYPAVPSGVTSASFDIGLLFTLLRNICKLPEPVSGWDRMPAECDVAAVDDVVRFKLYRNDLNHRSNTSITEADFKDYWNGITAALVRCLGDNFRDEIKRFECEAMDPQFEEHYVSRLKEWCANETCVNEKLLEIKELISALAPQPEITQRKDAVPRQPTLQRYALALGSTSSHERNCPQEALESWRNDQATGDAETRQPTSQRYAFALGSSSSVERNCPQEALEIFRNDQATGATGFSNQAINIRCLQWLRTEPVETIVNKMLQHFEINSQSSLQNYDENTRKRIRSFSQFVKSRPVERKDLFDSIRENVRSGSTGPYLDERIFIADLPFKVGEKLSVNILHYDKWKHLASEVGLSNQEIGAMEKKGEPENQVLKEWGRKGLRVKDLYDFLVSIECEVIADIL